MTMQELGSKLTELQYTIKSNKIVLDRARKELLETKELIGVLDQANTVLKVIGENKKRATIEMFERVVTASLKEVFDFDYRFIIEVSSDKKILTKFKLRQPNGLELDVMDSCGGGVVDVVSFVLKALMLASIRPKRTQVMFLDESFSRVSSDYVPKVADLLVSLSKQLNMKFLLVTHQTYFLEVATHGYEISKQGNEVIFNRTV